MMTNMLRMVLFTGLFGVYGMAAAAATDAPPPVDRRALEAVADRDERDTPDKLRAMAVCGSGFATKEVPDIAVACDTAYTHALHGGEYDQAMRYALLGCEKYQNPGLCRRAGGLPMLMGNRGIAIPPGFKADIKRAAVAVCFSGKRIKSITGADVTARECNYFARLFGLAKDPEYTHALAPAAMRFYESLYEPEHAGKLYAAGCEGLGSTWSCQSAREMRAAVRGATLSHVDHVD